MTAPHEGQGRQHSSSCPASGGTCCVFQGLVDVDVTLLTSRRALALTLSSGVEASRGSTSSNQPAT